ncbi:hypothetical protein [Sporosarcina cascadiensis]|uniref:hypothetical protein n=1 Tax=Sporosarcina cascadiensis TaxID=2660747 RepID=UPI00129A4E09|nr:hypothetical protein [Sporosarcina cascadiensis]
MHDYKEFYINSFETYSFTRLVRTQNFEFYFILGRNDVRNFNECWDGRLTEVLGYLVMYSDVQNDKQISYIYLIEDENKDFLDITLHTRMFVNEMYTYLMNFDMGDDENFIIKKTNVYQKELLEENIGEFIKKVVDEDIPEIALNEII